MRSQKTLIAVSGGVDSVVLMHLFHKAGFLAGVAHCNFGLRDDDSDEDERFVKELALKYNYPIYVKRFETKKFAKTHSVSTQMAARELRYNWFRELANEHGYDWVATAHHANDSVETTLLNLTRGTGLAGIHGINLVTGQVIRPLLFASREDIEEYLKRNNLVWREDRTNASTDYKRNLIRHKVIPLLEEMNPGFVNTSRITLERLRAADVLLASFLNLWKKEAIVTIGDEMHISLERLLSSVEPVYGLWFILQDYGFGYEQVHQIFESVSKISGKFFCSSTHTVLKDRDSLIVRENGPVELKEVLTIPDVDGIYSIGEEHIELNSLSKLLDFEVVREKCIAFFDQGLLKFPLCVRNWEMGDVFFPFGMGGKSKKISDLLIDLKLSMFKKQKVKVLLNGDGAIIWVMGFRTDERFKITDKTQGILKVTVGR